MDPTDLLAELVEEELHLPTGHPRGQMPHQPHRQPRPVRDAQLAPDPVHHRADRLVIRASRIAAADPFDHGSASAVYPSSITAPTSVSTSVRVSS